MLAVWAEQPDANGDPELLRRDLARIGVDLQVREFADPTAAANDPRERIDALLTGWGPDYPDPFSSVNVILEPSARVPFFPDFFGDPRWVRRMRRAAAAPLERRAAVYAKLDADLARGPAPFAVLGSVAGVPQLLSSRLGCERFAYGRLDLASVCIEGE